jgi:hypothetical protein
MRRILTFALLSVSSAACRNQDRELLDDLVVASAELRALRTGRVAVLGGPVSGAADLVIVDDQGLEWTFPAALRGATLGFIVEVSADPGWHGAVPIGLEEVEGVPTGDLLLGRFRGGVVGVQAGFGLVGRDLRNRHGATLDHAYFSVGVGVFVGWEWLRIRLEGDDDVEDPFDDETGGDER